MENTYYAPFKKSVSKLGYGMMRFPVLDNSFDKIDFEAVEKLIDRAIAGGINYFDTAYPYHGRNSEYVVSRILSRYPRESYFVADKMPGWLVTEPADCERLFNEQLKKTGLEYFDFYLAHSLSRTAAEKYKKLGIFDFLAEKKASGKVKSLGFSFHDVPESLPGILSLGIWDFVQIQFNYIDYTVQRAKEQFDIIRSYGLPVIIMEPVRGGALASLCPDAASLLKAERPDASLASWAIRYCASKDGVLTVLSGMSTMGQLEDNLKTMNSFEPVSEKENELLQKAAKLYIESKKIPCTACRYCMDCPSGVDIPLMFKLYNDFVGLEDKAALKNKLNETDPANLADKCISCLSCVPSCPQHIDIPAELEKVKKLISRK